MITNQERMNLKRGDIVSRKFRGAVSNYVITATTANRQHFWVLDLQYGDDAFYEEHHDLTQPKWSIVSIAN